MSYKVIKSIAAEIGSFSKFEESSIYLLGGADVIQSENEFSKWDTHNIWKKFLYTEQYPETRGYLWFDILLWYPQNNNFLMRTIYNAFKLSNQKEIFIKIQEIIQKKIATNSIETIANFILTKVPPDKRKAVILFKSKEYGREMLEWSCTDDIIFLKLDIGNVKSLLNQLCLQLNIPYDSFEDYSIGKIERYLRILHSISNWVSYIFLPIPTVFPVTSGLAFAIDDKTVTQEDYQKIVTELNSKSFVIDQLVEYSVRKTIFSYSTKTAISTIMSRNLSHNIGSHILINIEKNTKSDNKLLNDLKYFTSYLRTRMDFLALIATSWPSWSLPTRFLQDLMFNFFQQMPLLQYIGASEKLDENKLKFYFYIQQEYGELVFSPCNKSDRYRSNVLKYDIWLSVLGSIVGRQALYVIFENIIRNSAKHSFKEQNELQIHVRIKRDTDMYKLEIWDNVSECLLSKYNDYKLIRKNRKILVENINRKIKTQENINEYGKLKNFIKDEINIFIKDERFQTYKEMLFEEFLSLIIKELGASAEIIDELHCVKYKIIGPIQVSDKNSLVNEIKDKIKQCISEIKPKNSNEVSQKENLSEKRIFERIYNIFDITYKQESTIKVNKELNILESIDRIDSKDIKLSEDDEFLLKLYDITDNRSFKQFVISDNDNDGIIIDIIKNIEDEILQSYLNENNQSDLVYLMDSKIMQPIINEIGETQKGDWGIAEMKIASAFIQKKSSEVLGFDGDENFKMIEAAPGILNDKLYLKYILSLPISKEVIVVNFSDAIKNEEVKKLEHENIFIVNYESESMSNIFKNKDCEFMLIIPPSEENLKHEITDTIFDDIGANIEKLPTRLFWVGNKQDFTHYENTHPFALKRIAVLSLDDYSVKLRNNEGGSFKIWIYTEWIKHLRDKVRKDIVEGKQFNLYLSFTENTSKSSSVNKPYISEYLKKYYSYLIPPTLENISTDDSDTEADWKKINNVKNDDLKNVLNKVIVKEAIVTDGMPVIAYPRHGLTGDLFVSNVKDYDKSKPLIYCENLSGASPHFTLIASPPSDMYLSIKLALMLIEGGLLRVAVADERIGKEIGNKLDSLAIYSISKFTKQKANENDQPLSLDISSEKGKEVFIGKNCLCDNIGNQFKFDILILHQGIIDKFLKEGFWINRNAIEKWLCCLKENIPFIVVTSGRGKPSEIPENVKFISFSDISHSFMGDESTKCLLTSILMNTKV